MMTRLFATRAFYQAEIPGAEMAEGFLEYRITAVTENHVLAGWPGLDAWRRVPITRDETGPSIQILPPLVDGLSLRVERPAKSGKAVSLNTTRFAGTRPSTLNQSVALSCDVTDPAGVAHVWLRLRSLASLEPWRSIEMMPAGNRYSVRIPLTAAGLQYSFEATDAWGNATMTPDAAAPTPYLLLPPGRPLPRAATTASAR